MRSVGRLLDRVEKLSALTHKIVVGVNDKQRGLVAFVIRCRHGDSLEKNVVPKQPKIGIPSLTRFVHRRQKFIDRENLMSKGWIRDLYSCRVSLRGEFRY